MLHDLVEWLRSQYGSNEFLVGTTVPFILGAIAYAIRTWAVMLYGYFVRNFTVAIRVNSTTEHFVEVNEYIFEKFVWGIFRRNFVLSYVFSKSKLIMTSGYGRSIALVNGRPGFVELTAEESDSYAFKEYLELKVLTLRPNRTAQELFSEIERHVEEVDEKDRVDVYKTVLGDRIRVATKPKRPLSTIFIPTAIKERVMGALTKFQESEKAYIEKGLPWHLGVILHGPPGTGKTSLIHAIASELGRDVHYHTTGSLAHVSLDAAKTILVLEDFDAADFETTDAEEGKEATKASSTLSDTLNFLDGFLTPHGLIVIATTNHLSRLDDAVIRPGRFDLVEEIPAMEKPEYEQMCAFYCVEPDAKFEPGSGAKLMARIKNDWASGKEL